MDSSIKIKQEQIEEEEDEDEDGNSFHLRQAIRHSATVRAHTVFCS